jgi:hypothetical protein
MTQSNALLRLGLIGLSITLVLNLLGDFGFHRSTALFFTEHWWTSWFPSWIVWVVLTIIGLGARRQAKAVA